MADEKKHNFDEIEEKKKDIEIVSGDGKNLDISPVYDHIKMEKTTNTPSKDKEIVIPKTKKDSEGEK